MLKRHPKLVIFLALLLALCLPVIASGRATLLFAQAQNTSTARSSAFYEEHERYHEAGESRETAGQRRTRRLHRVFDRPALRSERRATAVVPCPTREWWHANQVPLRPVDYLLAPLPMRAPPVA